MATTTQTQTAAPVSPAPVRIELAITDVVAGLSVRAPERLRPSV